MSDLHDMTDNPRVRLELGFTQNLGDFNSLRMLLGVEVNSRPNEEWTETVDREYETLERKVLEKKRDVESQLEE